ncbi:hypothetical protein JL720_3724 [Aureococcus anophagefferens]|nr:hypothetical protein JL720_3724 [Aureococcus anophagefferens]
MFRVCAAALGRVARGGAEALVEATGPTGAATLRVETGARRSRISSGADGGVSAVLRRAVVACGGDADLAFDAVNGDVAADVALSAPRVDASGAENFEAAGAEPGALTGALVAVAKPLSRKGAGKVSGGRRRGRTRP